MISSKPRWACGLACLPVTAIFLCLALHKEVESQDRPRVLRREPPARFAPQPLKGRANIPRDVDFGLVTEIDGIIQTRDWSVRGTVTQTATELIRFRTTSGGSGRLAYRLPGRLRLELTVGQPITIVHDHEVFEKRLLYDMHISSSGSLILATSHGHRERAPADSNSAELIYTGQQDGQPPGRALFFWSHPEEHDLKLKTKHVQSSHAPISIKLGEGGKPLASKLGERASSAITLGESKYLFVLLASHHLDYSDHAEKEFGRGTSHFLHYLLVRTAD